MLERWNEVGGFDSSAMGFAQAVIFEPGARLPLRGMLFEVGALAVVPASGSD